MMKLTRKSVAALTASLMLCGMLPCLPAAAEELTYGDLTYENYGVYLAITGCSKEAVTVEIPAEIDGIPVTYIEDSAFKYCENITAITLPDTMGYIGSNAFDSCTSLTEITIPASVYGMGADVFDDCDSLQSIVVEEGCENFRSVDGVLYSQDLVHMYCYPNAKTDTSYSFPAETTDSADIENEYLTSITLSAGMEMDERSASGFIYCPSLTELNVDAGNTTLKSVDGVVYSMDGTILYSYPAGREAETYAVPDGVTTIAAYAFCNNKQVLSVTLPDSVKTIGMNAFYDCRKLQSVQLSDGLESIGDSAFGFCYALTDVRIPDTVTELEGWAFIYCTSLSAIAIPETITEINAGMFQGCSGLKNVDLPEGLKTIDMYTFYDCTGLEELYIPAGLTSIGLSAFKGCTALTDIYYAGSETEWSNVSVDMENDSFLNATVHFAGTAPVIIPSLADLNADNTVNASDAALLLTAAAAAGTGGASGLTEAQEAAADLNADGAFDAKDAALILQYAAYTGSGGTDTITDYIAKLV